MFVMSWLVGCLLLVVLYAHNFTDQLSSVLPGEIERSSLLRIMEGEDKRTAVRYYVWLSSSRFCLLRALFKLRLHEEHVSFFKR